MAAPGLTQEETDRVGVLETRILRGDAPDAEVAEYHALKRKVDTSRGPRMEGDVLYLPSWASETPGFKAEGLKVVWIEEGSTILMHKLRDCRKIFRTGRRPWDSDMARQSCSRFLTILESLSPEEWARHEEEEDLPHLKEHASLALQEKEEPRLVYYSQTVYHGIGAWLGTLENEAGVPPVG